MNKRGKVPETKYEKTIRRRGVLLMAVSLVIALGLQLMGIVLGRWLPAAVEMAGVLFWLCCVLPVVGVVVSLLLRGHYAARINDMQVGEMQTYFLAHREKAAEQSADALRALRRTRRQTDVLAVLLVLFGLGAAVSGGMLCSVEWGILVVFLSALYILCGLTQIRFPVPKAVFAEDRSYLDPQKYPELFALARKAADVMGCRGPIEIGVNGDFNGGISRVGGVYAIRLGVLLLNLLSKEELYAVLLHEFGHMVAENAEDDREKSYFDWLNNGRTPHALYWLVWLCYGYLDTVYSWQMLLFDYACSVLCETAADRAMAEHGDPAYAASALLKMKYYDLFDWEDGTEDTVMFYASPEAPRHVFTDQIERFRNALDKRESQWKELVDCEILSRTASHPTLKMRLAALGITECRIAESEDSGAYREECSRVKELVEARAYERGQESYKGKRLEVYLQPLARVAEWEQAGRPLTPEGYADVVDDLRSVGRVTDAMALCGRAIEELDTAASCYAYYMRGMHRLHCYDPAGMDDLYHAMENNTNYIEEGLEAIGQFCCLTGRQEKLDDYREWAVDVAQRQKDVYSEMNILRKKDKLLPERLPEDLMAGLLDCTRDLDEGNIQSVYLVRKVITDDFFASAVIVRFAKGVPDERRSNILHRLFRYLDTCSDWQFALFDYDEVKKVKVERIPDSCIYQKERNET